MPNDHRQRLLRALKQEIEEMLPLGEESTRAARYLQYLIETFDSINGERYLSRPKSYCRHELHLDNGLRFHDNRALHRNLLRMTMDEFDRIHDMFGSHDVFISTGRKPQAHAQLQLRVCIHRLAHGNTVGSIQALFRISSEYSRR